ncbi:MAG: putative DNA binding domain-containing protein [Proteobacteria bacterium]|nr:putative DNA binding domain-containing protein [Pseudomonadota bacterium]
MRSVQEIRDLLDRLDEADADSIEGQDLDFKRWNERSLPDMIELLVEAAVCMANGGGGTVVLGVADREVGREAAILGVPLEIDINKLIHAVYNKTDPRLTPEFEELRVPEGTGRLLLMQVRGPMRPYTDTAGRGTIRIEKSCEPLTGTTRRDLLVATGQADFSAQLIDAGLSDLSPSALEALRRAARVERSPDDLLALSDRDLIDTLGLAPHGRLSIAALLLAGTPEAIARHVPGYGWTHLRMQTATDYSDRADGADAIPIALARLTDRIMADNPIVTVQRGLYHFEFRAYPEVALREALLNALCHADYQRGAPILVKQYSQKLEISNPGGLVGGITPTNILHHPPMPRNPLLVNALVRLRLVNRSNLGMGRMYKAFLLEGKPPPLIEEHGAAVVVTFRRHEFSEAFRRFAAEEFAAGRDLGVDQLLVLNHLLTHPEIDTATAARLCQRDEAAIRETLNAMETDHACFLQRGGTGRGTYWTLRSDLMRRLGGDVEPDRHSRTDWEAAKTRVLSVLRQRLQRGEAGLANAEVRAITRFDRRQVNRLIHELQAEGLARIDGHGRGARYVAMGTSE